MTSSKPMKDGVVAVAVFVDVQLHDDAIGPFLYGTGGPIVSATRRFGEQVRSAAVRRAPRDSGTMANSITVRVGIAPGFVFAVIAANTHYATWVHEGTGIYGPRHRRIVPVTAQALRFTSGRAIGPVARGGTPQAGGVVFARSVAGSPPNPFLVDALQEVMGGMAGVKIRRFRYRR